MTFRRCLIALTLAPLSTLIPVGIGMVYENPGINWFPILMYLTGMASIILSFAYLLLILLPVHLYLVRRGWSRWWIYTLIGALFGGAGYLGFDLFTGGWSPPREYLMVVAVCVTSSYVFWAVLRPWSRP